MKPRSDEPIHLILGLDGEPFHGDDGCPVCAQLQTQGVQLHTRSEAGELIPLESRAPEMIEVLVRGTASTWPYLPLEPLPCPVPVGCVVGDLLEYLCSSNPDFRIAFGPGTLSARIDGQICEPLRVLRPKDLVVVSGRRDAELSRMMAELFRPPTS